MAQPGAAAPAASNDLVITKPQIFDGMLSKYAAWMRSLNLYMVFNTAKFPNDGTKVACALTYMTEGSASAWAQSYFDDHWAAGAFAPDTWAVFTGKLDEVFKDPNEA